MSAKRKKDAETAAESAEFVDTNDDMYDAPEAVQGDHLLARGLRTLAEICQPYWSANHDAIRLQKRHRWITRIALGTATFAVALAIYQLPHLAQPPPADGTQSTQSAATSELSSKPPDSPRPTPSTPSPKPPRPEWEGKGMPVLEGVAALAAFFFVGWGLILAVQKHWLLERHKAERLRFLKYRSMLQLATTRNSAAAFQEWAYAAAQEASDILKTEESDLDRWIKENQRVEKSQESLHPAMHQADFHELLEYYKRKRLDPQVRYFCRRAIATSKSHGWTRLLPPLLFLASLILAISHFAIDIFVHPEPKSSLCLIMWAALLPLFAAAIRTYRSAHEYSRNTVRFGAMYQDLREASHELPGLPDATAQLRKLWECEESLEDEHREWLRLMDEAEWYG